MKNSKKSKKVIRNGIYKNTKVNRKTGKAGKSYGYLQYIKEIQGGKKDAE